jgi:hypothetical protein
VDPFPDPLLFRKSGSAGNRSRTSGSVARNSDHWTTEASVNIDLGKIRTEFNSTGSKVRTVAEFMEMVINF